MIKKNKKLYWSVKSKLSAHSVNAFQTRFGKKRFIATFLLGLLCAVSSFAQKAALVREETVRIEGPIRGLKLGLRHAESQEIKERSSNRVVLILHGSAVPVSGNPAYKFGSDSMMTALAKQGLDVWAVDFYGFGESDRYPEMNEPADKHPPLGTASECSDQVASVVEFLKRERKVEKIMLIGDSGGSLVAGVFATRRPELVSRLVLFAPVTPFTDGSSPDEILPAYSLITPQNLWSVFTSWSEEVGPNVLDSTAYKDWAVAYLQSDPTSGSRDPASVRVPNGRAADIAAIVSGRFPYDPGKIKSPTLIVMGEFDKVATFPGAEWLLKSLKQAPTRRLDIIGHGAHLIQYETGRTELYRVLTAFLKEQTENR